jgi:hypothetical protein
MKSTKTYFKKNITKILKKKEKKKAIHCGLLL